MEVISVEKEEIIHSFSAQSSMIAEEEQYLNLADFLKGTISGDELVNFVCDRLDEKYSKIQQCSL